MRFDQNPVFPDYFSEEMRAITNLAGSGQVEAQLAMAGMYSEGDGVPQNPAEGLHWYLKAAKQDNAEAMLQAGRCYAKGLGADRNMKLALKWYHEAGAAGSAEAQYLLGTMYARGRNVQQDYTKAAGWFRAAARGGNKQAELIYGLMLRDGRGMQKNLAKAYIWLLNAAKSQADDERDPVLTKALSELERQLTPEDKRLAETMMETILGDVVAPAPSAGDVIGAA